MNPFQELMDLKKAYDDKVAAFGKDAVVAAFAPFFGAHPEASAVRWRQYTPYFNDGDACEFSVHEMRVRFGDDNESGDYEDGFVESWDVREDAAKKAALGDLPDIPDDVLRAVFGDHVEVTVTRDGCESEEHSHD